MSPSSALLCPRASASDPALGRFIAEDPGRQTLSGSFNPIDTGEWSEQAYILPTARLFSAIAARDRPAVHALLAAGAREDVNRRDHVGRTALHVAIFADAADVACDLVDAGARMSARLVGGGARRCIWRRSGGWRAWCASCWSAAR